MKKPVQINMPSPCRIKEELMTPVDGGWFCGGCQKKVYDFTNYSDEQLAKIYQNKEGRCGMFLDFQINRPLVVPKRSINLWFAATAAVMGFLALGNNKTTAQETVPAATNISQAEHAQEQKMITGNVRRIWGSGVERAKIKIKGTSNTVYTDEDGNFKIFAKKGDVLKITAKKCKPHIIIISDDTEYNVVLRYRDESLNRRRNPGYF